MTAPRPWLRRILPTLLALAIGAGPATAAPILFPPTPDGPAEWRDETDVAPYLAAWKAHGFARSRARQAAATANQAAYDVRGYALDLTFAPTTSTVSGTVRVQADVVAGPLGTLDLDLLANMTVDGVTAGGVPVGWTRTADVVSVLLDRSYATGETMDVRITYHGTPVAGSFGFRTANGRPLVWSLSEPYGARSWWPCKDLPEDKADSVFIRFTLPTGMVTASNGRRVSAVDDGVTSVAVWRESYPITTYLVSIASYPYTTTLDWFRHSPTDSMRLEFYNFPESVPTVAAVQAKVRTMLGAFTERFGPYPFLTEKYGHAEFVFGGGMEHQTCSSMGSFSEFVVAHELAHQWWGDWVTCRDFHEIWLNEGFATYSEALWAESVGGPTAYRADLAANKHYGPGSVWVPDDRNVSRIFDSNLSYDKGSWVLHMLRGVLGDSTFFRALRTYGNAHAYGTAATADLRAVCEAESGLDLAAFFQQWVYGEYHPIYRASWSSAPAPGGHAVTLTLEQRQGWQLFRMPVRIRVHTEAGPRDLVVQDSLASQVFTLLVDARPTDLEVDPDEWILRQIERTVEDPAFDRSVLVVNGVDWATYGTEIVAAYNERALQGDYTVDFWDHFPAPAAGYPATLPAPLGRGAVPPSVLGRYRTVIWVGNDFNGDLDSWIQTPILSYLRAGGNVLLMTRQGDQFLTDSLRTYLGVTVAQSGVTFTDCLATRPGLSNLSRTGTQSLCMVLDTVRTRPDTDLLWKTTAGFTPQRGLGVVRRPAAGAGLRPTGGRFAFLSGRPYRWNRAQLRAAVNTVVSQYLLEPLNGLGVTDPPPTVTLAPVAPNPARDGCAVRFTIATPGTVRLEVLDAAGRRVRTLREGALAAGTHSIAWDGHDSDRRRTAPGLYFVRLSTPGAGSHTQRFVLLH